jgi:hypothetical protein
MLDVVVLDGFMELAFALQENPSRWFPRKITVLLKVSVFTVLQHLR